MRLRFKPLLEGQFNQMKALGFVAWICLASIVSAVIDTAVANRLWLWFVARDYGHGPSLGAWFGLVTIIRLVQMTGKSSSQKEPQPIGGIVGPAITRWLLCGLVLALSWVVGVTCGWI